jgi:anti-sigma-K factor RskA
MLTCELLDELRDAYALGALEPDEVAQLEAHAETCPDCRALLDASTSVAAVLAFAAPQVDPPARLGPAILKAARGEIEVRAPRPVSWWRRLFPSPTRIALGAASFASLAFVATLSWALTLQSELSARPIAPNSAAAAVAAGAPGGEWGEWTVSRANMKRLAASERAPDARCWMYIDPSSDSALLVAYKLPQLPPEQGYQLWLVKDGQRASGGVFTVDSEGYGWLKVQAPQRVGEYQRAGITIEPRTGSPGPTGARVLGGDL